MGTSLELRVLADDLERGPGRGERRCFGEIDRLVTVFSGYDASSEFSRWQAARERPVRLSPELFEVLSACDRWRDRSGGAFDPRVEALTRLWTGPAERDRLPSSGELGLARAIMTPPAWRLDPAGQTAERLSDVPLSLNAIAKGEIVERACDCCSVQSRGVRGLLLNVGGDLRVCGDGPRTLGIAISPGRIRNRPANRAHRGEGPGRRHQRQLPARVSDRAVAGTLISSIPGPESLPIEVAGATVDRPAVGRCRRPGHDLQCASPRGEPAAGPVDSGRRMPDRRQSRRADHAERRMASIRRVPRPQLALAGAETSAAGIPRPARPAGGQSLMGPGVRAGGQLRDQSPCGSGAAVPPALRGHLGREPDGFPVRNLTLWVSMGGAGPFQWLPDLKRWYKCRPGSESRLTRKDMFFTIARPTRPPGKYKVIWDGKDDQGKPVPSGRVHDLHRRGSRAWDLPEHPQGSDARRTSHSRGAQGRRGDQGGRDRVSPQRPGEAAPVRGTRRGSTTLPPQAGHPVREDRALATYLRLDVRPGGRPVLQCHGHHPQPPRLVLRRGPAERPVQGPSIPSCCISTHCRSARHVDEPADPSGQVASWRWSRPCGKPTAFGAPWPTSGSTTPSAR